MNRTNLLEMKNINRKVKRKATIKCFYSVKVNKLSYCTVEAITEEGKNVLALNNYYAQLSLTDKNINNKIIINTKILLF